MLVVINGARRAARIGAQKSSTGLWTQGFPAELNHARMTDVEALIASYARLGLFKHIGTVCNEVITKRGSDPTIALWSSLIALRDGMFRALRLLGF